MTVCLVAYLGVSLRSPTALFLPGQTTDGHYQIESKCETCHTPLGGVEQEACLRCHGEELKVAQDSHPPSKFTDPRNADRVALLDATRCITCHTEHRPGHTGPMGVTLPRDYCFKCHENVGEERPSHLGSAFSTCADAGCHNFHDNRALYEDFLVREGPGPDNRQAAVLPARRRERSAPAATLTNVPDGQRDAEIEASVAASAHASIGCTGCHDPTDPLAAGWSSQPPPEVCRSCHGEAATSFESGRHGMRLAVNLSAMRPELARRPMHAAARRRELGCGSCHDVHSVDTTVAAVTACESCHSDEHTRAYRTSEHFRLWLQSVSRSTSAAPAGPSCANCHLPRVRDDEVVRVDHNQNANLRPNEKMIRQVCLACHGLQFAVDALADADLVARNFNGTPTTTVESIRMALSKKTP